MLKGVNIDITNNPPDVKLLKASGCDAVRFPARPGIEWYVDQLNWYDIRSISVVDKKAAGYIVQPASMHQIHNEPDVSGQASGTMPFDQMIGELVIYRDTYPDLVLIAPGLAAGDYSAAYLKGIANTLRTYRYAAWAIHPYAKSPTGARDLFNAHQSVLVSVPGLYTECHPSDVEMRLMYRTARDAGCAGVFYHCWTDAMTLAAEGLRMGLVDEHNKHKTAFDLWNLV